MNNSMKAFHIDMNIAQFRGDYLETWIRELAALGYDTILWEVENNVRWETCPECVSPDAFSKEEFGRLLALCRELGLENIPLFQTLAHCEYVLKHVPYQPLSEMKDDISQYCPSNPDVPPFLDRWISEYLDLFGPIRLFHLGADEAIRLGQCEACRAFADRHSLSELFIRHVNRISRTLTERQVRPAIWADMVLHHPEALEKLSRDIMLFDWHYEIYRGNGKVQIWGEGRKGAETLSRAAIKRFGPYLFPDGDEPGSVPETFYSADYLQAQGFDVVGCPGSSIGGDNVWTPRNRLHMLNTLGWTRKGMEPGKAGVCLTSWTVRLLPWETQWACIDLLPDAARNPDRPLDVFQKDFLKRRFGSDDASFWRACGLLSKSCLFTSSNTLGFDKSARRVPAHHVERRLAQLKEDKRLDHELENACERLREYEAGLLGLETFGRGIGSGRNLLNVWTLMARNLVNRARVSAWLLHRAGGRVSSECDADLPTLNPVPLREEMRALRSETESFYAQAIKPVRTADIMHWMYDAVDAALAQ